MGDVFLIDAQKNDKELAVNIVEFRQRVLIEQDLIRAENYINEVI
jgi:secreted trypsin-like serine protease